MKTYLNLAAGRKHLPSTPTENWINVDRAKSVHADLVLDLFKMPYPWADNSIAGIHVAHFIEHIPHDLRPYNSRALPWQTLKKRLMSLDGFFAFFEECGRILEPGGWVDIECPYGWSNGGLQDPTHTRYIVGQSFGYLAPQEDSAPFDYGFRYHFAAKSPQDIGLELMTHEGETNEQVYARVDMELNVARNIYIKLTVIK